MTGDPKAKLRAKMKTLKKKQKALKAKKNLKARRARKILKAKKVRKAKKALKARQKLRRIKAKAKAKKSKRVKKVKKGKKVVKKFSPKVYAKIMKKAIAYYDQKWSECLKKVKAGIAQKKTLLDIWWDLLLVECKPTVFKAFMIHGKKVSPKTRKQQIQNWSIAIQPIMDAIDDTVDCVIEFGSGWGRNLYYIIDKLKREDVDYYGFEYRQAGVDTCLELNKVVPEFNVSGAQFDYNNPKFTLKKKYKNIVIFTRHSIEQIRMMKPNLFHKLLELETNFVVLHSEPIGWQIPDKADWGQTKRKMSQDVRHNANLYQLIRNLEKQKKLVIEKIDVDYHATFPVRNASTLVKWRKRLPGEDLSKYPREHVEDKKEEAETSAS